jgi:uncharacterized membrane protein
MELTRTNPEQINVGDAERWVSVVGGGLLAIYGLTRRNRQGAMLALMGGGLAYRGMTGHSRLYEGLEVGRYAGANMETSAVHGHAIRVERSVTIRRPIHEVFRLWRKLENLPRIMRHLESVLPLGGSRFHWTVKGPFGSVAWDAEIIGERENEFIAWRSLEGSQVDNAGSVQFEDAPDEQGTDVKVSLVYKPPAGPLGALIARWLGEEPGQQVDGDLRRFKQVMEAGAPAVDGDSTPLDGRIPALEDRPFTRRG